MAKRGLLLGATALVVLGADGRGADPVKTPTPDKPPTESKPRRVFSNLEGTELSDPDQREYLKLQLSLAEKNGKKTKQEIEELKKAIAELDERTSHWLEATGSTTAGKADSESSYDFEACSVN